MHLHKVKDRVLESLSKDSFSWHKYSLRAYQFRSKSGSEFLWKLDTSSWCWGSRSLSETFLLAVGTQQLHWDERRRKNRQPVRSHLSPTVNNCHVQLECVSFSRDNHNNNKKTNFFHLFSLLSQMQWFTSGVLAKSITVSLVTHSSAAKNETFHHFTRTNCHLLSLLRKWKLNETNAHDGNCT